MLFRQGAAERALCCLLHSAGWDGGWGGEQGTALHGADTASPGTLHFALFGLLPALLNRGHLGRTLLSRVSPRFWSSHGLAGYLEAAVCATWHADAGSNSSARDGSSKWSPRSRLDPDPQHLPGGSPGNRGSGMLVPKAAAPVASGFASTGMRDEKGCSPACLQPTSGTDMDPILQTVAHVPLPLEDFSKTRLSTADLQRFLKQRGDSRGATNYVDEEPDSK